jgi:hypothetical protein
MRRQLVLVAVAVVVAMTLFVGLAALQGGAGFPLDDAWIHQTYARNLVRSGRWEFIPGVVSAGSTAPLWTLLLAIGYLFRFPYLWWAYLLGGASLWWLAWAGMQLWRQLWPDYAASARIAGLALVLLWPLVWAAASGMETLLFAAIGLQVVAWSLRPMPGLKQISVIGIFCGLLILTRPDGLVLVLLVLAQVVINGWRKSARWSRLTCLIVLLVTVAIPLVPYFLFNWQASGTIWPNTFYAKQAEYEILLGQPLLLRIWRLFFYSLGGPQGSSHILLLPGLVLTAWLAVRRDWEAKRFYYLLPLLWAGGHVILYAWRLPVTYQHGRYLMPTIPIWTLYGLAGWRILLGRPVDSSLFQLGKRTATLSFALLLVIFLLLGAINGYASDVAFIEGEMVTVAQWLRDNTPPEALIASHDIGAIGYFAERPLLDLAGLISPEVVDMLADEQVISQYVLNSNADYLVTAPGWPYSRVAAAEKVVLSYSTDYEWTQEQGMNNMTVYKLP